MVTATRNNPSIFASLPRGRNGIAIPIETQVQYETDCRSWNRLSSLIKSLSEKTVLAYLYLEWSGPHRPHIITRLRYHHSRLRGERENYELFGRSNVEVTRNAST